MGTTPNRGYRYPEVSSRAEVPKDMKVFLEAIDADMAGTVSSNDPRLEGNVKTTDPRLTDKRAPTPHHHQVSDVFGLEGALRNFDWLYTATAGQAAEGLPPDPVPPEQSVMNRLAALEYSSGPRDITGLVTGVSSGTIYAIRKGFHVTVSFDTVTFAEEGWATLCKLPVGWRPPFNVRETLVVIPPGPQIAIYSNGNVGCNKRFDHPLRSTLTYVTTDPIPTSSLGSPA